MLIISSGPAADHRHGWHGQSWAGGRPEAPGALGSSRVTVASPLSTAAGQFAPSRGNYQRRAGPALGKGPYLG